MEPTCAWLPGVGATLFSEEAEEIGQMMADRESSPNEEDHCAEIAAGRATGDALSHMGCTQVDGSQANSRRRCQELLSLHFIDQGFGNEGALPC